MRYGPLARSSARSLAAACLAGCLAGCVFVPTPEILSGRNRWQGVAGDAGSSARVKVGTSTRADVRAALGEPLAPYPPDQPARPDRWEYEKVTTSVYIVFLWPFIHGGPVQPYAVRDDRLAVWFGADGRVTRYAIWGTGERPPDDARTEAKRDELHTGPTTAAVPTSPAAGRAD